MKVFIFQNIDIMRSRACVSLLFFVFGLLLLPGCGEEELPEGPVVTTLSVADITSASAVSGGNVTGEKNEAITAKGICWNVTGNPDLTDNTTDEGSGTGTFVSRLNGLTKATVYYVRAYATGRGGVIYGDEKKFITKSGVPSLVTFSATDITDKSAQSGGVIDDDGGTAVTGKGTCWNVTGTPTIEDPKTCDGKGAGNFISLLSDLESATTYYIRAYATNRYGTTYGCEKKFTTKSKTTN